MAGIARNIDEILNTVQHCWFVGIQNDDSGAIFFQLTIENLSYLFVDLYSDLAIEIFIAGFGFQQAMRFTYLRQQKDLIKNWF